MASLFKFEIVELPKIYLVGKESKYNIELHIKGDNRIPAFWDKCLADGTFPVLEKKSEHICEPAYVGTTIDWDMGYGTFSYICGMLFKEAVTVPDGYVMRELGAEKVGLCWIKGKNTEDVCSNAHRLAEQAIKSNGFYPNQMKWTMELFNNPRYTTPDENGEIILDYYIPLAQSFESLGKRIIHPYLAAYPAFKPVSDFNVSEKAQLQMYDFIYESLTTIITDLSIINVGHEPDDCFEHWQMNNSKPELMYKMQKIRKNFFNLFEYFIKIGLSGEALQDGLFIHKNNLGITQKTMDKLLLFGLICMENEDGYFITHNKHKEMFSAWKLHCLISKDNKIKTQDIMTFMLGCHGDKKYTAAEMFGKVGNAALITELEQFFSTKGYTLKNDELRVTYEKEYPDKQKAHLNIFYDWRKVNPMTFEFKAPHFSEVLKNYNQMDDELKALVFNRTKICDGCGYCTQTDKTGKRPRLTMSLELNGETLPKCPLFPSLVWGGVNEKMITIVKKLFNFAENVLYCK